MTRNELYSDILQALQEHRLGDALYMLKQLLEQKQNWQTATRVSDLSVAYDMMLQYMERGIKDEQRRSLYMQFIRQAYELADEAFLQTADVAGTPETDDGLEKVVRRLEETAEAIQGNRFDHESACYAQTNEKLQAERFNTLEGLFDGVVRGGIWEVRHAETARAFMASMAVPTVDKALFVSAVTVSLQKRFDPRKLLFLLECYSADTPEEVLIQRAFTGFFFAYLQHHRRMEAYPEITARISLLADEPRFQKDLAGLQIQLLMTLETQNIQKQMQEDIIPSMMKNPHFKATKFGFEETDFLPQNNETNPEWESESLRNIEKKIGRIAELQAEGADIYMGTFSNLKRYPFFNVACNWFLPFDTNHPSVCKLFASTSGKDGVSMLKMFISSDALCDSDKYSFCLMTASIPAMHLEQMQQMINKLQDANVSLTDHMLQAKKSDPAVLRRHYLQDWYRYSKLCQRKQHAVDIFRENLVLIDYPLLRECIRDLQPIREIADFAFKQKLYTLALKFYLFLENKGVSSPEIFQKMAFCHQQDKQYDTAITLLEKANLLKPNSKWVLTHLAQCYTATGLYEKASVYYQMLELMDPDNPSILYALGKCLIQNKEYQQALDRFYKLDFLTPNSGKVQRAIAWCLILTRKPEQATIYYRRLLEKSPKAEDHLNAGHAAWGQGNLTEAIAHYTTAFRENGASNTRSIIGKLQEDAAELANLGITNDDICIVSDLIAKHLWPTA